MLIGALVFGLGACLLGWHRSHEQLRAKQQKTHLLERQIDRLLEQHQPDRKLAPPPEYWSDDVYLRLCRDIDINPGREAHSHATKTATTLPPEESA